jgi:hypothetical protein
MAFQKQGLQWCIEKEYPKLPSTDAGSPVQFWQFKRDRTRVSGLHVLCDKVSHGSTLLRRLTTLIVSMGRLFYSLLTPFPSMSVVTKTPRSSPPTLGRGGLFADGKQNGLISLYILSYDDLVNRFSLAMVRGCSILLPLGPHNFRDLYV